MHIFEKQNKQKSVHTISFLKTANCESTDDVRHIEFLRDETDIAEGVDDPEPASLIKGVWS